MEHATAYKLSFFFLSYYYFYSVVAALVVLSILLLLFISWQVDACLGTCLFGQRAVWSNHQALVRQFIGVCNLASCLVCFYYDNDAICTCTCIRVCISHATS